MGKKLLKKENIMVEKFVVRVGELLEDFYKLEDEDSVENEDGSVSFSNFQKLSLSHGILVGFFHVISEGIRNTKDEEMRIFHKTYLCFSDGYVHISSGFVIGCSEFVIGDYEAKILNTEQVLKTIITLANFLEKKPISKLTTKKNINDVKKGKAMCWGFRPIDEVVDSSLKKTKGYLAFEKIIEILFSIGDDGEVKNFKGIVVKTPNINIYPENTK